MRGGGPAGARAQRLRQTIVGLVALPLSAIPFVGYSTLTPEGRLVRDRAVVALAPPTLPTLTARQKAAAVARAPRYDGGVMSLAYHGMTFVGLYMSVLVFQTYWGILTMRDTRWGTRSSTVEHARIDQALVTALPPAEPETEELERSRPFRHLVGSRP